MKKRIMVLGFVLLAMQTAGFGTIHTPTISGATGLIKMPTADVLGQKEYNMAIDYVFEGASGSAEGASDIGGAWQYKANIGSFLGHAKGLEFGFVGRTEYGTPKEGVFINLKYNLSSSDDPDALKLAIGVENISSHYESDAYIVASKYWRGGAGIHFGAMFDFPQNSKFRPLGMLGINLPLGDRKFTVMAELFAGESVFQADMGFLYAVNNNIGLMARGLNLTGTENARNQKSFSAGLSLFNFL